MSSCGDAARERRRIQAQPRNALPLRPPVCYADGKLCRSDPTLVWQWGSWSSRHDFCNCESWVLLQRAGTWLVWGLHRRPLASLEPRVGDSTAFVVICYVVFSTLLHRTHRAQFPPGVSTCCIAFLQLSSIGCRAWALGEVG